MHDKRYQVFISSTFEDLKEERRAVQDLIISTGDFPVQMESFPAADEDQFAFIRTLIDKCDYYVLIVAGRYGTPAEDGVSYTEKEYRYAVSVGVPILVMLHGDRGKIPADKTEDSPKGKARLAAFIEEVQRNRLRKTWTTLDGLKLAVREALDNAKATKPRVGWVRGDMVASVDALEELNALRKENSKLRDAIGNLEIELAMPPLPPADGPVEINLVAKSVQGRNGNISRGSWAKIRGTWIGLFPLFFSNLKWTTNRWDGEEVFFVDEDESCSAIGAAFAAELTMFDTEGLFKISKSTLDRLTSYYIEVGLMKAEGDHPFTDAAQRLARRHRISGAAGNPITVVAGEVEVTVEPPARTDLDDIPF